MLWAASIAAAAALVLVAIVSQSLPSGQSHAVRRTELDSTAGLPEGWHKDRDSNGRTYYWNRKLGTSSWNPPQKTAAPVKPRPEVQHFLRQREDAAGEVARKGEAVIGKGGASLWNGGTTATQPRAIQPLPITVSADGRASGAGWDQMAVPLNQLVESSQRGARSSVQPRTLQALAPEEGAGDEGGDDEKKIAGEITPTAGWPRDLMGASGDDTSWIVGMHREPIWTDSMTHACGLTDPCPTGRADHGHGMQMDSNPYVDKRRTFDPYAFGDPYADPATRAETYPGRSNYPWDPTQDAQFYGKKGADCSDGYLRDECYERPELDDLQKKQAVWKAKYDEFAAPGEEEEAAAEAEEGSDEEKSEEEKEEEANAAQKAKEAAMKKDGLDGALLHMPEVTPWARTIKTGMLKAEESMKTGMLHASAAVKATARKAAADAQEREKSAQFVGGEPVMASLSHVVNKVKAAYQSGEGFFTKANLSELERKFLRAHGSRAQQQLSRHQAMREFEGDVLHPEKTTTTVLAAVASPTPAATAIKTPGSAAPGKSAGHKAVGASIWESPTLVAAKGLFGSAQAAQDVKERRAATKAAKNRAAAAKVLASVGQGKKQEGPLPQVRAEAIKVAEEAEAGAEKLMTKITGKAHPAPWEMANMQKGVLKKQSTESNLMQLVKEHDNKLLQEASGLSADDLKRAVDDAARKSHASKKATLTSKVLEPWEQKVAQQGSLKHETVEQNLKAALKAREKMLWKEKTGWKSLDDMKQAEAFADNLEREIQARHKEEAAHPLMPATAESMLESESSSGAASKPKAAPDGELVKARAKEAKEQRELNRLREGEPLVKALQVEVRNDEAELADEAEQQRLTIRQLHRDQSKLNKQLAKEMGGGTAAKATARKAAHVEEADRGNGWRVATGMKLATTKAPQERKVGGRHHEYYDGLSDERAKDDLDEYFAKQEVGIPSLHHPGHRQKSH